MKRLYYQHVFDELEYMREYIDSLFQQIQESSPIALLPASDEPSRKLLPEVQDNLTITITESKNEFVINAELIPEDLKMDITIGLLHPQALKISCVRREWKKENKLDYSMCKHIYGYISQIVPLPKPVTEEGSTGSIKNGILEIRLKKLEPE